MNAGKAAYILSKLLEHAEVTPHVRMSGLEIDAITFAYSALQNMANAEQEKPEPVEGSL